MKSYRKGKVFYKNEIAGYLTEAEEGFAFNYDKDFLKKNIRISISLPPSSTTYKSKELFPFFNGLLPEGWYLEIVLLTFKLDMEDAFGVLLETTNLDTIGAVTVKKDES